MSVHARFPLADASYRPRHVPIDGRVPDVVAKWGPRSQLRWFRRFGAELRPLRAEEWTRFYCDSTQHRGLCCSSCLQDEEIEGAPVYDDFCCCEGYRAAGR